MLDIVILLNCSIESVNFVLRGDVAKFALKDEFITEIIDFIEVVDH